MLDELLKELDELKSFKKKCECLQIDKQKMSDRIYELEIEKYNRKTSNDHREDYIYSHCKACRNYQGDCDCVYCLPSDIEKPIPSDKAWMPSFIGCKDFEWS